MSEATLSTQDAPVLSPSQLALKRWERRLEQGRNTWWRFIREPLAVIGLLMLGACETPKDVGRQYVLPEQCQGDLNRYPRVANAIIVRVPRNVLDATAGNLPDGFTYNGRYIGVVGADIIQIPSDLSGEKYDDALRHEQCHIIAGQWHPNILKAANDR